jgi:hypothetical protein
MSAGKWSELSAEHEITTRERVDLHYHDFQDIGVSEGIVWVGGWGVQFKDQTAVSHVSCSATSSNLGVEVAGNPPPKQTVMSAAISGLEKGR